MSEIVTISSPPSVTIENDEISLSLSAPQITVTDEPHVDSYAYPVLSQTTSYRTGDEGWQIANVWNSIYGDGATERVAVAELSNFYTLKTNNQFGNTFRFTDSSGNAISDAANLNTEIYDNYLGLAYYIDTSNTGITWENSIDNALAFSGVSGEWYLCPYIIFALLKDDEILSNTLNNKMDLPNCWTSTTTSGTPVAYQYFEVLKQIRSANKTTLYNAAFYYKLI